jgi:hypothetical protein
VVSRTGRSNPTSRQNFPQAVTAIFGAKLVPRTFSLFDFVGISGDAVKQDQKFDSWCSLFGLVHCCSGETCFFNGQSPIDYEVAIFFMSA